MNHDPLSTLPVAPEVALQAFASGSDADASRSLAWTAPSELGIDLDDPAQRCFGDYELLERIGVGGMGAVYRARQHGLDREVALKFLAAGPWASDEFIARFRREARAAARMQHPNIVEIYDTGEREGLYYFSMRLVSGPSLAQRLLRQGPLPIREAAGLLRTIAEAIDYAHRLGVLHLDLKPANVLIGPQGEPLVADFGLARRIDEGPNAADDIAGTPSYMAPEQASARQQPIGPAADLYGLGATLYELLVGGPPFRGKNAMDTLTRLLRDPPIPPRARRREIPADLDAIVLKCLAKDPAERYASARELADDLGRFLDGRPVSVRVPGVIERTRRWVSRNRAATAAWLVLLAGTLATTWQWHQAETARAEAVAQRLEIEAQKARSEQLVALIAQSFPVPKDRPTMDALQEASRRVVGWLQSTLSEDPVAQQEVLLQLMDALDRADNPGATASLLAPIVQRLGADYRRMAAEAQIAQGTAQGRLLGAILLQSDEMSPALQERQWQLLGDALESAPDNIDLLAATVYYCSDDPPCPLAMRARTRLTELQPRNAANWIYAILDDDPIPAQREKLRAAARAPDFDDHFDRVWQLGREAMRSSGVPLPELLQTAAARLSAEVAPEEVVSYFHAWSMPLMSWRAPSTLCRPDHPAMQDAALRQHCLAVALRAMSESRALVGQLVASAMVRHLAPGSAEALRARELRRDYLYVQTVLASRTPMQIRAGRDELQERELPLYGELEAAKRTLDRAGIPRDPPAEWQPEDPEQLMTRYEREVFRARKADLARQLILPTPVGDPRE